MFKKWMNKAKIREKLIVMNLSIVSLLTIISIGIIIYGVRVFEEMLYEASFKYLEQSTNEIDDAISKMEAYTYNFLSDKDIQVILNNIKQAPNRYEELQEVDKLSKKVLIYTASEKHISSFYYFDTDDDTYIGGINPTSIDEKNRLNIINKALKAEGEFIIYEGTSDNGYIVGARQIRKTAELSLENLGIVAFRLDLDNIVRQYLKNAEYNDSEFMIISPEGLVIHKGDAVDEEVVLQSVLTGNRGYTFITMNGEEYYCAFSVSDYSGWRYVNLISYDDAFKRTEQLRTVIVIVFGMAIMIAAYLSFVTAANITKPIQLLTKRMKKVENGDFSLDFVPFEYENRMDEVGLLHKDFEIMIQRIDALIEEDYRKQIIIKDTSLKALQSQINPHFLYNTLESINCLAKVKNETEISMMTESLGKLMRNAVDNRNMMISISLEIELLEAYIRIQRCRFEERLVFRNNIGQQYRNCKIPKLTFQPIIENAIKHGLENMLEPCHIILEAEDDGEYFLIQIRDNGPGMPDEMVEKINGNKEYESKTGLGIGIININKRLKMVFGNEYGLSVESKIGSGTTVFIRIPSIRKGDHV